MRSDHGDKGGGTDLRRGRGGQGQLPGEQGVRVSTLTFILIIYHQGDSGGPLTYESGDQHILIGDVSFGSGCAGVWLENLRQNLMFALGGIVWCVRTNFLLQNLD